MKVLRPGDTTEERRSTRPPVPRAAPAWARRRAQRGRCCRLAPRPTRLTSRWGRDGMGQQRARRRPPAVGVFRRRRACNGLRRGCWPRSSLVPPKGRLAVQCCRGRRRSSRRRRCSNRSFSGGGGSSSSSLRRRRSSSSSIFVRARPRRGCGGRRPRRRSSRRRTAWPKALSPPGSNSEAAVRGTMQAARAEAAAALDAAEGNLEGERGTARGGGGSSGGGGGGGS